MNKLKNRIVFPALLLMSLMMIGAIGPYPITPVHATTTWPILVDANSTGPTDANPQTTSTVVKTFSLGLILEANSTTPMNGVFGWQVGIIYDNTTVTPQGDPMAASPTDGAVNTVNFGAQAGPGNPNWAGLILAGKAFGSFSLAEPHIDNHHKEIQVFFTMFFPNPAQNIGPTTTATVKGNLLASVTFELIKPAAPLAFSINSPDTKFVDGSTNIIGFGDGLPVSVNITNNPPVASFTATLLPSGDSACTPLTNVTCSGFAVRLDASASSDSDGTISNPAGYFWDWGDGTQDNVNNGACGLNLCNQGKVAVHDYGFAAKYNATLRVIDDQGATGSARDALGATIRNIQPSHTMQVLFVGTPPDTTSTSVACNPSPDNLGSATTCSSTVTDTSTGPLAPTGAVTFASNSTGNFASPSCTLSAINASSASCNVSYTPTSFGNGAHNITASYPGDANHASSAGSFILAISVPHPTTTKVTCITPTVVNQGSACSVVVNDTSTTGYSIPTGSITFSSSGSAAGSFNSATCSLFMVTNRTSNCPSGVTFTPSTGGTAMITGSYGGDSNHATSSSSPFSITVSLRGTGTIVTCTTPDKTGITSPCTVTVTDSSPGTSITPAGTFTLTTSSSGTFTGSCTLAGTGNSATCSVGYVPSAVGTHTVTANYPGDSTHASSTGTFAVTVTQNQAPTLTITPPSTPAPGQSFSLSLSAADPDGTVSNVTINWGDGSSPQVIQGNPTTATHTYAAVGTYNVTVTVRDNGGIATEKSSLVTVANPSSISLETIALIALPLIIVAVVALLLLRRRRTKSLTQPGTQPAKN